MIQFLKKQWLSVIIIIIWIMASLHTNNVNKNSIKENNIIKKEIDGLKVSKKKNIFKLDSISKINTKSVNKINIIKEKEDEQVKAVDSFSISELQLYFSKRYTK